MTNQSLEEMAALAIRSRADITPGGAKVLARAVLATVLPEIVNTINDRRHGAPPSWRHGLEEAARIVCEATP